MIELEDMTKEEYIKIKIKLISGYAQDRAKASGLPIKSEMEIAKAQTEGLLSDGVNTTDHHLTFIIDCETREKIGFFWYFEDKKQEKIIIFNIEIFESYRGKGFAKETLSHLKIIAKKNGIGKLGLTVWSANKSAKKLYEKMGFKEEARTMGLWIK